MDNDYGYQYLVVLHYREGGAPINRLFALKENAYNDAEKQSEFVGGILSSVEVWRMPIIDNARHWHKMPDADCLAQYTKPAREYDDHNQIMEQFNAR